MKTNLDQFFKTNEQYENDGVDFVIVENDKEKCAMRVRRFSETNPRTKAAMAHYYKPFARQIDLGTMEPTKQQEILMKVFIDVCLVSWTGIKDDSGKELELTKENALALFKSLPVLFTAVWQHANDPNNYKEDLGNS